MNWRAGLAAKHGVKVVYSPADMSKADSIGTMMEFAKREFGGIDILVNNAGIQFVAPIDEFPLEKWDAIIAIKLSSVFHITRLALSHMKKQGWGRIVNMASAHAPVHRDCGVDHRRLITDRGRLDRALTGTGGPPTKYEPCYIMTIEVIMQEFNCNVIKRPQWTHAMALERRLGLPRGMLLSRAPDAQTPVTRVLALSRLDGVMLRHFTHMLRVTVKDWMASIA